MTPEQALDYPFPQPPPPGETIEVAEGVHWLRMPLPFALDHINLWLLEDGPGFVIVDCGIGNEVTRTLWESVFETRIGARAVHQVIMTHCHPDHAGNAAWLCERFGAPLAASQGDYLTAHAWRDDGAGFTGAELVSFYRANGLDEAHLEGLKDRGNAYKRAVPDFPRRYRRVVDGDEIAIGRRSWQVMMGYGHAPEHASLWCAEERLCISGDMLLPRISTNVSVSSVSPESNPLKQFLDSIARMSSVLSADALVLPSHGLPFRGAHERVAQLEEHHRLRLAELEEACAEPKCAAEAIVTLFRRKLDTHQTFFAMGEALAHLNYLLAQGRLQRTVAGDGVARFARP